MSDATKYSETKDSGIAWIGTIPEHWNVRTLYQLITRVNNKNSDLAEKNLLSLSYGKIKRKDINTNDGLLPASFDGYNVIEAGDIVLRLTDLQNDHTSLRVGHATERGIITSAYTTLRPINPASSGYLYYLIHAFDLKKGFYGMGSGVRQGLNYDEVKELRVILPPQEEQDAIVRFLNEQCAKIDDLINDAKISIDEYTQWRASVIYNAVTKGIDDNVSFNETDLPWISKIPVTWSLKAIKYTFSIKSGATPKSDNPDYWDGDIVWITPADYKTEDKYIATGKRNLTVEGYNSCSTELVPIGSLVFSKRAPIGAVAISQNELCTNQGCLCCVPISESNIEYFYYVMSAFTEQFNLYGSGTTFKEISAYTFGNFLLPCPPLDSQNHITEYLNNICENINSLINEKRALINDLEQYKRSLIYETVTGKRKVV